MSELYLKGLWPGIEAQTLRAFVDSDLGGPVVWQAMCSKYLFRRTWESRAAQLKAIWALPSLPRHHRTVMAMTSNLSMITKANYGKAAADIRAWVSDFGAAGHWLEIASELDNDPGCPAIGFCLISTLTDQWSQTQDGGSGQIIDIDWEKAWSIYDVVAIAFPKDTHYASPVRRSYAP